MSPTRAPSASVRTMVDADVDTWAADAAAGGAPLPDRVEGDGWEALELTLDGVPVGGAVLSYVHDEHQDRASIRHLQTTVPHGETAAWGAVLTALERHVTARGVRTLVTAVPLGLLAAYQAAGFGATMTTVARDLDVPLPPELVQDTRVTVRAMDAAERAAFVPEVRAFLDAGMRSAGVLVGATPLGELEARLQGLLALTDDPQPGAAYDVTTERELLTTGLVDGVPAVRGWCTLVPRPEGLLLLGHTLDVVPELRGQGLVSSFLADMARHARELGVREARIRIYGHDTGLRELFLGYGCHIHDVHLRKDLTA